MEKNKFIKRIVILLILFYIISSFYFVFKTDEEVSMGLIQHNFNNIISISSLDVHPPFYYLALKVFLILITFWTKSIFIKVIVARLFSFILLLLFIFFAIRLLKNINIEIDSGYQILCFLIAPGVINESAKIRMYSLAAFLLVFELYQLILFVRNDRVISLILATISAILASYTFYPLAISVGLFVLSFFIWELLCKHYKNSLFLFISGICIILLYIPGIKIAFTQFKFHSINDGSLVNNYFYIIINTITQLNAPTPASPLLKYISIASIIVIFLFVLLIIYSYIYSSRMFNNILTIILINFLLTLIISVIICKRQFRLTILYPIYSIFIFLLIAVLIKYFVLFSVNNIFKYFILFTGLIFFVYAMAACLNNVKSYDIPSVRLIQMFHQWKINDTKDININKDISIKLLNNRNIQGNVTYAKQDADYLKSLDKNAVIKVPTNKKNYEHFVSESSNKVAYNFSHELFPNLKFKR